MSGITPVDEMSCIDRLREKDTKKKGGALSQFLLIPINNILSRNPVPAIQKPPPETPIHPTKNRAGELTGELIFCFVSHRT